MYSLGASKGAKLPFWLPSCQKQVDFADWQVLLLLQCVHIQETVLSGNSILMASEQQMQP